MPCYHPLSGWYAKRRNDKTGKRAIVFNLNDGFKDRPVPVPCGTCTGCLLEKARQWAVRCMHEASLWDNNCFVTLTYDEAHLPSNGSLVPEHFVNFMKRLRNRFPGVRFYQAGEYGEQLGRPHHHALLFNVEFGDRVPLQGFNVGPNRLYSSVTLDKLWGHGFCSIGEVTFESAGYVARYTMKKVHGSKAIEHYNGRVPEYATMSRRPGIGRGWIDKFWKDVYPSDEMVVNGAVSKPPRYYDDVVSVLAPAAVDGVKTVRRGRGASNPDGTGSRLVVREAVKQAAIKSLRRS